MAITERAVIKTTKDIFPILKASLSLSSRSKIVRAYLKDSVYYVEFNANTEQFSKAGSMALAMYILSVMITCYELLMGFEDMASSVEVLCWTEKESHKIKTPMEILKPLFETTDGSLGKIAENIVCQWVSDSTYIYSK